jgi:hypothetical protein
VIKIDLICEVCGTSNPPGTEFCTNCNSYLAWDRSVLAKPSGKPGPPTSPVPNPPPPTSNVTAGQSSQPAAGYIDPAYAGQGYYDAGYNQGAYYQGGYDQGGAPTLQQNAYDMSCPSCGTINPGTRRFCSRCGYAFVSGEMPGQYGYGYYSAAGEAAQDRAARKAYRRSLPPLYRWRRVIIGVLVAALVITAAVLAGNSVRLAKDGWYSLRRQYVPVTPVIATVVPPEAAAPKSDPAALVDESENEFTMNWAPSQESKCSAPGIGVIVLTFAPTRIRLIKIAPGLSDSNPQRKLQPLPKVIGIAFDDGPCQSFTLTATPGQQKIKIDSGRPVTRMLIGIGSAYPAPNGQPLISFTEVILKAYPS